MKVIIAGSRNWTHIDTFGVAMEKFAARHAITEVITGGATGADLLGKTWAKAMKLPHREFLADWDTYGKYAGPRRNEEMANEGEALVAFRRSGTSPGTDDIVRQARARNLLVWVVNPKGEIQVFSSQGDLFAK